MERPSFFKRNNRRIGNLLKLARKKFDLQLEPTPYEEIANWGRVRLLKYQPRIKTNFKPLLMLPSIINRYYILDLRLGQSYIGFLVDHGVPVYLLDWGVPSPQDRYATMEDHILRWTGAAVRKVCADANQPQLHLLGYCIGGTFAAAYTAVRPERVASLIALAAPFNFHDDGLLSRWSSGDDTDIRRMANHFGLIPSEILQQSFSLLNPVASQKKAYVLYDRLWDDAFVEKFLALEKWLNDNVPFPGETFVRHIQDLYVGNKLIKGEFQLQGQVVQLKNITCPVFSAVATSDHIVPERSAAILNDLVGSKDKKLAQLKGGHIGVTVGRSAEAGLWQQTLDWVAARTESHLS